MLTFKVRETKATDKDGRIIDIVTVEDIPCGDKFVERSRSGKIVHTLTCDRPINHLPSLKHSDSMERAVWYRSNVE